MSTGTLSLPGRGLQSQHSTHFCRRSRSALENARTCDKRGGAFHVAVVVSRLGCATPRETRTCPSERRGARHWRSAAWVVNLTVDEHPRALSSRSAHAANVLGVVRRGKRGAVLA